MIMDREEEIEDSLLIKFAKGTVMFLSDIVAMPLSRIYI